MSGLLSVAYFLTTLTFSLALFILWARLALRYFKVSALHPVAHSIYNLTDPLIKPIDQLILQDKKARKPYDWACLALIVIVELIKFIILGLILYGTILPISYLIMFVFTDLIVQPCNLLFYIILIRVIMSWVNPVWQHPIADVMKVISDPILIFARRLIPDISGIDFSPFVVMVLLKVVTLFMSASMPLKLI